MGTTFSRFKVRTTAGTDILDITGEIQSRVKEAGVKEGIVTVSCAGSTAAITTIEYESGAVEDLKRAIERMAPQNMEYEHDSRWGDGNGYAHVRAALMKPSITIPVHGNEPILGTWQQVVLLDFDNRPRRREVVVQVMGE